MSLTRPGSKDAPSVLFIGYGNPGRCDDGLGPALADRLETADLTGVDILSDYQLNIEHAHDLAAYDIAIFADAAHPGFGDSGAEAAFTFRELEAGNPTSFSTHSVSPQAVLRLANDMFQAKTQSYVLAITGDRFDEFSEGLSGKATENLEKAEAFIIDWLTQRQT